VVFLPLSRDLPWLTLKTYHFDFSIGKPYIIYSPKQTEGPLKDKKRKITGIISMKTLFALLTAALLSKPLVSIYAQPKMTFVVYGTIGCSECRSELKTISELFGNESVVFYELSGPKGAEVASMVDEIYELAFPQGIRAAPLVLVLSQERIVAVLAGYHGQGFLSSLEGRISPGSVLVSYEEHELRYLVGDEVERLEEILTSKPSSIQFELKEFFILAAADSVNPCTFVVFATLLVLSMASGGRRRALRSGIAFIAAIYLCYFLLGLGLLTIAPILRTLTPFLSAALIALGVFELRNFQSGVHRAPLPKPLRKITIRRFEIFEDSASSVEAITLGALVSFTLLPCSMGPYLLASSFLVGINRTRAFLALILYNSVFISPLIAILLGVWAGLKSRTMKRWIGTKVTGVDLISGVLLSSLGAYFLATSYDTPLLIRASLGAAGVIIPFLDLEKVRSLNARFTLIFSMGAIASLCLARSDPLKAFSCSSFILVSTAMWSKGKRYLAIILFALTCSSILWFSLSIPSWRAQVVVRWPDGTFVEFPQYSCGCHREESSSLRIVGRPSSIEIRVRQQDEASRVKVRWILSVDGVEISSGESEVGSDQIVSNVHVESLEDIMRCSGVTEGGLSLKIWLYHLGNWQGRAYENMATIKMGKDGQIKEISWEKILNEEIVESNISGWLALAALVFSIPAAIELRKYDKGTQDFLTKRNMESSQ